MSKENGEEDTVGCGWLFGAIVVILILAFVLLLVITKGIPSIKYEGLCISHGYDEADEREGKWFCVTKHEDDTISLTPIEAVYE